MTLATALIHGVFEAALFGFLGQVVDWLARPRPPRCGASTAKSTLAPMLAGAGRGIALCGAATRIKHQSLAGNFPIVRLRWNFHRRMLGQSMAFYQDEFAGRVATKVMQTALAVRDTVPLVTDILVFVTIYFYFVTMVIMVGGFDAWLLVPFLGWMALYVAQLLVSPRWRGRAQEQADARSLMTGRITDAYTNIATVKLFSHARREAGYARSRDGGVPRTVPPDAHGQRLRDRQPRAVDAAGRQHHRPGAGLWTKGRWAPARWRRRRRWRCA